MSEQVLSEVPFSSLGLDPRLVESLNRIGFSHCTPIQAKTLPLALAGRDVAGQAQTGTGKTAAFLLATMDRLLKQAAGPGRRPNQPRALILAPTRELAVQIHKDAEAIGADTGLILGLAYGGTGYESQRKTLEAGVDILIGTPGRIIDYFKQHVFDLKAIQVVVVDEADRMFDLGFIRDIRFLLRRCPPPEERLGLLFSATLAWRVTELAYEHMNDPQMTKIEADRVTAEQVRQVVYHAANEEKIPLLLGIMERIDPTRSLVFVNTKRAADRVCGYLKGNGIEAEVLSGDVPQKKRLRLLRQFEEGQLPVLVATDVAARGLHIPDVTHIFNFDLPQDAEDYVHRIGRTARFGAEGDAISFACEEYVYSLPEIEQYIGHPIPVEPVDDTLLKTPKPAIRERRRPRPGERRGGSGGGERRRATGGGGDPERPAGEGGHRGRPRRSRPKQAT